MMLKVLSESIKYVVILSKFTKQKITLCYYLFKTNNLLKWNKQEKPNNKRYIYIYLARKAKILMRRSCFRVTEF